MFVFFKVLNKFPILQAARHKLMPVRYKNTFAYLKSNTCKLTFIVAYCTLKLDNNVTLTINKWTVWLIDMIDQVNMYK